MKQSAGLLVYRRAPELEVLLAHMGGPFWAKKDDGAWTIPKGEFSSPEKPLEAALREFKEETGITPVGQTFALPTIRQAGGKIVHAWALEMDCELANFKSNTFRIELPKGSGKFREFPEIDKVAWFGLPHARVKILKSQIPLLEILAAVIDKQDRA